MTDRHCGYVVTLDKDIREDDAEAIISAMMMLRGVLTVEPVTADPGTMIAESRARRFFADKLCAVLTNPDA